MYFVILFGVKKKQTIAFVEPHEKIYTDFEIKCKTDICQQFQVACLHYSCRQKRKLGVEYSIQTKSSFTAHA